MTTKTRAPQERVAVVGGGLMGSGIAEIVARSGAETIVIDTTRDALTGARQRIERSLQHAVTRAKLTESERAEALARLAFSSELSSVTDRTLVIEAATEDEATKLRLFASIGKLLEDPEALVLSNTSSIPIVKLGAVSGRPGKVMGVHFFNPVPVMQLVELIPSLMTAPQTVVRVTGFIEKCLFKHSIIASDRAGFVVNSLLVPYILSAIRMYEAGYASAADIDRGMVLGCGHPMGPLALADLIGLDTLHAIGGSLYEEFKEPLYSPPPLLDRMVEAGLLGRKSGHGFYPHEDR